MSDSILTRTMELLYADARQEALEEAARIAERMCPAGGRAWTEEQLACHNALTACAQNIRALKVKP